MGYSHQWYYDDTDPQWAAGFDNLVADARTLVTAAPVPVHADLTVDHIRINGIGADALETLVLRRRTSNPFIPPQLLNLDGTVHTEADGRPFAFVKTGYRPYDDVVTAVLLAATTRLGTAIEVHSDGRWDAWAPARNLIAAVLGPDRVPDRPTCINP